MKKNAYAVTLAGILAVIMGGLMLVNALTGVFYAKDMFEAYAPGGMFAEVETEDDVYSLDEFMMEMSMGNDATAYYRENKALVQGITAATAALALAASVLVIFEVIRPGTVWRIRMICVMALLWEGLNLILTLGSGAELMWMSYLLPGLAVAAVIVSLLPQVEISGAAKRIVLAVAGVLAGGFGTEYLIALRFGDGIYEVINYMIYEAEMYFEAMEMPIWMSLGNRGMFAAALGMMLACGILAVICTATGKCRAGVKWTALIAVIISSAETVFAEIIGHDVSIGYFWFAWLCAFAAPMMAVIIAGSMKNEKATAAETVKEVREKKKIRKKEKDFVESVSELMKIGAGDEEIIERIGEDAGEKAECALFIEAVKYGRHMVAERLLAGGVDPDAKDGEGCTALMHVVMANDLEMVKVILAGGADVNARDRQKNTALHLCNGKGGLEILKFLIESGADIKAQNRDGDVPRDNFINIPEALAVFDREK